MSFFLKYKDVVIVFIIWIIVVNLFALVVLNRFDLNGDTAYSWIPTEDYYQEQGLHFDIIHAQWDSFWLLDIVQDGYYLRGEEEIANVVFFPLYIILIKVGTMIIDNAIFVGWLVSSVSLFFAMIFLTKLIRAFYPKIKSLDALLFLLIFPTAYFFNTVYTESLFLFLSIATIYYAKKNNMLLVAVFGFLAALTRITGILLLIPILWYVLEYYQFHIKKIFAWKNLYILAIPLGTLLFFLYHYIAFDSFLLFFEMESLWGRSFEINRDHFVADNPIATVNLMMDILFGLFAFVTTFFVWKKIDKGLGLYMLVTILVAISTGTLMSIGRYILVLFPIYIFAASITNTYIKLAWLLSSCMLFTLYTILFVNHYWAG